MLFTSVSSPQFTFETFFVFVFKTALRNSDQRPPAVSSDIGTAFVTALVKPFFVGVKAVDSAFELGAGCPAFKLQLAAVHLRENLRA
jgi:hypothetical protein